MKANLSVIITNRNKPENQILECLQSLKDQTVYPKEVIFVDDCSDNPRSYPDVLSIILSDNKGVAFARDVGVRMSTGKLLLFVDSDDKLAPDFIQQCGKHILSADIVYPNMLYFGDIEKNKLYESPEKITPEYLLGKRLNIPVTSMMWKKVYESNNGFNSMPVFEDWDFWIRAMCNGYTFKKANTLLWYRQSNNSRNHKPLELRELVHSEMTKPYKIQNGRIICNIKEIK